VKVAYFVDSPQNVPERIRTRMVVVNDTNYQDVYSSYLGMTQPLIMYVHKELRSEKLLKFVEEYKGNLAVYFSGKVSLVLLSRFNQYENRRTYERQEFPKTSPTEELVKTVKQFILG